MTRTVSATISTAVDQTVTKPIYLVRMGWVVENRSCSYDANITWNAETWTASGLSVVNLDSDGGTLILRQEVPDLEWTAPIAVGDDVYIGLRSIVLPGVTIGDRCIIGAAAVVTHDVPSNSVAAGVPARPLCTVDDYLQRMREKSLGLGHLSRTDKARELRRIYDVR